jgi:uroporphyrinogen III methyltransferase / synthase
VSGVVYLVGAGPGDPSLLTLRARELIDACDVVAYDELLSDALLASVPPRAELLAVGRRGHDGPRAGHRVHPAVVERARAGLTVVRLKAGDPLVFGRGGEEAEELRAAGIPFEIVPGISSVLGAAAYAGIPLTHRGVASAVTLTTGHDGAGPAGVDGTVVLFMAGKRLAENLQRIVDGGRAASTPAAYVAAATTGGQRVISGTIGDLHARIGAAAVDVDAPALVFVGDVVALRERVAWIESRPLHARRVVVARARPGRSQIATRLQTRGADVVEMPDIGVAPPASWQPLDRALVELGAYAAIVFASDEAVAHTVERLGAIGRDVRSLPSTPLVAVGARSGAAMRRHGLVAAIETSGACADALRPHARFAHGRLLVIADDSGRAQLAAELRALGATVAVVAAYRHTLRWLPVRGRGADLVVAPSSTAALQLGEGPHGAALRACRWLVMGPRTEAAARSVGAVEVVRADRDDVDAIVAKAEELLA